METGITWYNEKRNTLYILTEAITPENLKREGLREYLSKPYTERIAESPYKIQIEKELKKHPGCKISEYTNS